MKPTGPEDAPAIEISVVTPFYNEQENVAQFCAQVDGVLASLGEAYEIVAVEDGSSDRTAELLREMQVRYPALRLLRMARNRGQAIALHAGLRHSRGRYVVVMDGDLQHRPEDIPRLLEEIRKGYDLVSGSRVGRKESLLLKRAPSLAANFLLRRATGCEVRDMGGLSIMRGAIARGLRIRPGYHRLLPALVHLMGGTVSEIPIAAQPRVAGQSNYGISRTFDVFIDILMLWFISSTKSRPIYFLGRVSLGLLGAAGLIFLWLLAEKIILGHPLGVRPPFMISIFLALVAFIVFVAALIMEMLCEMQNSQTENQLYVLREDEDPAREPGHDA